MGTAVTATFAALCVFVTFLVPRCAAQPPPDYDLPPDSMVTTSGTTYFPTSYTLTNPACTGTSAVCPCAGGYMCLTIADCHWKCLMTSMPPMSSTVPTIPASVPASGPSMTPVATASAPGGASRTTSSATVTMPPTSGTKGGGPSSMPTETPPGHSSGGGPGPGPGKSSQEGGGSSSGGPGGSTRSGTHRTETAAPAQTTITVTHYPSTCKRRTGTTTLTTTDTVESCPATCPAKA